MRPPRATTSCSGTHAGLLARFLGNHTFIPIVGIGVSRDPADQEPIVHKEAQAVADLLGLGMPSRAKRCFLYPFKELNFDDLRRFTVIPSPYARSMVA